MVEGLMGWQRIWFGAVRLFCLHVWIFLSHVCNNVAVHNMCLFIYIWSFLSRVCNNIARYDVNLACRLLYCINLKIVYPTILHTVPGATYKCTEMCTYKTQTKTLYCHSSYCHIVQLWLHSKAISVERQCVFCYYVSYFYSDCHVAVCCTIIHTFWLLK